MAMTPVMNPEIINLPMPTTIAFGSSSTTLSVVTQSSRDGAWQPIVIFGNIAAAPANFTLTLPAGFGHSTTTGNGIPSASAPKSDTISPLGTSASTTSEGSMAAAPVTPTMTSDTSKPTLPTPSNSSGGSHTPSRSSAPKPSSPPDNRTSDHGRQEDSNSISRGAAAGIGVGCAVAGALIAAAIIALLFRRRRRHRPARSDVIPLNGFVSAEKSVASPDPSSPAGVVDRNLPQPAEDQALGGEMSRLRTSIKNHVQSYYHTNSVPGSVDQAALGLVAAGNMPLIASTLASLLSNPMTRVTAIRFCIAWVAISRVDQYCEPSRSFLPPEIASCLVSIASAREDPSTRLAFMSKWRAITANLLQSKYGHSTFTSYDPRNQNISDALGALDSILGPFAADERNSRERLQKLEEILRRAARFGFLLFSQPSTWEFDWATPPSAGRGALAVSPALVQVGDDNGRRLPRPRIVEEQELARGLESYL